MSEKQEAEASTEMLGPQGRPVAEMGLLVYKSILHLIIANPTGILKMFAPSFALKSLALYVAYTMFGGMGVFLFSIVFVDMLFFQIISFFTAWNQSSGEAVANAINQLRMQQKLIFETNANSPQPTEVAH